MWSFVEGDGNSMFMGAGFCNVLKCVTLLGKDADTTEVWDDMLRRSTIVAL